MLVQKHYEDLPDGRELVRTYSDENKYIQNMNDFKLYEEAIDVAPAPQYIETNIEIERNEEDQEDEGEEENESD